MDLSPVRLFLSTEAYQGYKLAHGKGSNMEHQWARTVHAGRAAFALLGAAVLVTPLIMTGKMWNAIPSASQQQDDKTALALAFALSGFNPLFLIGAGLARDMPKILFAVSATASAVLLAGVGLGIHNGMHKGVWKQFKRDLHYVWNPAAAGKAHYQQELVDKRDRMLSIFKWIFAPITVGAVALTLLNNR